MNAIVAIERKKPREDPTGKFSRRRKGERERERERRNRAKDLSPTPFVPSDAPLFPDAANYDAARSDRVKSPFAAGVSERDVFERIIELFRFLISFFLSLMSLFSQHRSSSGTRSSDSSQIVNGTAMFSACQSAPRNLTPRPCIHRPLFLETDGSLNSIKGKNCNSVELLVVSIRGDRDTFIVVSFFFLCVHEYYVKISYVCIFVFHRLAKFVEEIYKERRNVYVCDAYVHLCVRRNNERYTDASIGSTLESSFVVHLKIDPTGERRIYLQEGVQSIYKSDERLKFRVNYLIDIITFR